MASTLATMASNRLQPKEFFGGEGCVGMRSFTNCIELFRVLWCVLSFCLKNASYAGQVKLHSLLRLALFLAMLKQRTPPLHASRKCAEVTRSLQKVFRVSLYILVLLLLLPLPLALLPQRSTRLPTRRALPPRRYTSHKSEDNKMTLIQKKTLVKNN